MSYEEMSHSHCWEQTQPAACGQDLMKHKQCCLCSKQFTTRLQREVRDAWDEEHLTPVYDMLSPMQKREVKRLCRNENYSLRAAIEAVGVMCAYNPYDR